MKIFVAHVVLLNLFVGKKVNFELTISEGLIAPDLVLQKSVLINNQFPGPEIRAKAGDILEIKVNNMLNDNFTLHFHGIDQVNSNSMDGVAYVTQCPIAPSESFTYLFQAPDQPGTYYYHAHSGFHSTTAFGALIIEDDPKELKKLFEYNDEYRYDEERTILLSDIFDRNNTDLLQGIIGKNFKAAVGPRSVLINGQTYRKTWIKNFDTELGEFRMGHNVISVEKNKAYRFRVIGASTVSYYTLNIPNHQITVIEADGVLTRPVKTNYLKIHSGQRYSFILKANQESKLYWAHCKIEGRDDPGNGDAILHYLDSAENAQSYVYEHAPAPAEIPEDPEWIYRQLSVSGYYFEHRKNSFVYPVPKRINKRFIFDIHSRYVNDSTKYAIRNVVFGEPDVLRPVVNSEKYGKEVYEFNGTIYSTPDIPLIDKLKRGYHKKLPGVYEIKRGDEVEVIMENYIGKDGACYEHSWHLHGHHFYVVGWGSGSFDHEKYSPNLKNPALRDTTIVFRSPLKGNYLDGCGWKAIRFRANNPGAWLMDDNINFMRYMGVEVAFVYTE